MTEKWEDAEKKRKEEPVAQATNVCKCNSYFYRSTSLILWGGGIADSFAVITFTCAPAELFMKDLNGGYVTGKRIFFYTNNTKRTKRALKRMIKKYVTSMLNGVREGGTEGQMDSKLSLICLRARTGV